MKKFRLMGKEGDVFGGRIYEDNVYLKTYGKIEKGKPVCELELGESCLMKVRLSGETGLYRVLRCDDEGICPVCGELVDITGRSKDGRLTASCGDAFTLESWDA